MQISIKNPWLLQSLRVFLFLFSLNGACFAANISNQAVLVDPDGLESIATISQLPEERFTPLNGNLGKGYSYAVHWLRFTVTPSHAGRWWLEIQPPFLDSVRLFEPRLENGKIRYEEKRYGDLRPFAERDIPYRAFVAPLHLADTTPQTYYLRLSTSSTHILFLKLWEPEAFQQASALEYAWLGLNFGLLVTLLFINLFYWLWLRDPLHGQFSLYLFNQAMLYLGINGFVSQFIFPDLPELANGWLGFFLFAATASAAPLFRRIFMVDRSNRFLWWMLQGMTILPLILMLSLLTPYYPSAARLMMLSVVGTVSIGMFLACKNWRRNDISSTLVSLGILFSLFGGLLVALTVLGVINSEIWVLYSRQISLLGHILAFHVALASRMQEISRQHQEAIAQAQAADARSTEEKRAQEEHRQFIAMLTHELRTPLAVIDGAVQALEFLHKKPEHDVEIRFQRIRRSVGRINGLVRQFLAKDRVDDARLTLRPALLDAVELAREVIESSPNVITHRIDLLAPAEHPFSADQALMQVALGNLLDNALKYSPGEQRVELAIERLEHAGQSGVAWTFSDHGTGINPEKSGDVFDRYASGETRGQIAGAGLGLYLVKRIAELHGGHTQVIQRPGWGSSLRLWLPDMAPHTTLSTLDQQVA